MTPRLETPAQGSNLDKFETDFIMSEFLHEMDELDRLQSLTQLSECIDSKRQRELDTEDEPEPKKTRTIKASETSSLPIKQLPKKRRNTSWLRRKQELNALRSESEALATHVTSLQMQRAHKVLQHSSETLTEEQCMWQSVAAIARQEYRNALDENARLKGELQLCTRASKTLHAQVTDANTRCTHLFTSKSTFANTVRVGMIMSRRLHFDKSEIFDRLEKTVAARSLELDMIINEARPPVEEGASEHVQVRRGDGLDSAAVVEFRHARLLPFGGDTTANTIWEIIKLGGLITDRDVCVSRRSSDVVGMASRFTVPLDRANSISVSVDVHAVARRFTAPVGMVVLVESRSEWSVNHPKSGAWTHTTEEGGWVVVAELPHQDLGATSRTCQMRTAMKLRPDVGRAGSTFSGNVGDVVIPSFREILSSHHQSVENFLLDSSRTAAV